MKKYLFGLYLILAATMVVAASARVTPTDVLQLNVVGTHVNVTADPTTATYTVKMPLAQGGANQCLANDGSGNLSWLTRAAAGANADITSMSGLTGQILMAEGSPSTGGGFAFSESGNDTGVFSPSDGLISLWTNGAESAHFTSAGISQIRGVDYSWPNGQGGQYAALTNDGTGGLSWQDPLNQYITLAPVSSAGAPIQWTLRNALNPAANITGTSNQTLQLETNLGTNNSGFSLDSATTVSVNTNARNQSGWTGGLSIMSLASDIGNGTDAITGNNLFGFSLFQAVRDQATVSGSIYGITYGLNAEAGSSITDFFGYKTNSQIDDATNYGGFSLGDTLGTVSNSANVIDTNVSLTSGNQYRLASFASNISTLTGQFDGIHLTGTTGSSSGVTAFQDTSTYTTITSGGNYFGLNLTPNIGTSPGVYGLRFFPSITTATGTVSALEDGGTVATGTNYQSINLHPNATAMSGDIVGVNITPAGAAGNNAFGLNISMSGVTASGTKRAINASGDVSITGDLSGNGRFLYAPNAPYTPVNGGGAPGSVNLMISSMDVPASSTTANADTLGFNTASLITLGANSTTTSSGLGIGLASLGLPTVVTTHTGSSLDQATGTVAAISLDGSSTGGTIDNMDVFKAVVLDGGGAYTINKMMAYAFSLPFGDPATQTWGIYMSPATAENWLKKSLKIGGTAGSTDVVSNASVGLEVEDGAVYPKPMTTVARNALTPLTGFLVNNSTTGNLERYNGATWDTVSIGSFVPTTRTISTTAPLTGGGDLSANRTIAMPAATTSVDGYLTATDWGIFNGKGSVSSVALSVPSFLSVAGSPVTSSGTLAVTYSGTALPLANGGTGGTSGAAAIANISPLTTKGDLLGFSTTVNARVPVGTDGKVLTADSAAATGVSWQTPVDTGITELTGDVTAGPGSGSQAATIAALAVTNAKIANATIDLTSKVTGVLPVANGGTGVTTSTGSGSNVLNTSPTLVTPALGTPSSAVLTNATALPLTTGVTGVLPAANGGAGSWASCTPTFVGLGTVSNVSFFCRQVGDSYELSGTLTVGTSTAVAAALILPGGLTINTGKRGSVTTFEGLGSRLVGATVFGAGIQQIMFYDGSTNDRLFFCVTSTTGAFGKANGSTFTGSGEVLAIRINGIPII